jgi:hypothetical protein
MRDLASPGWVKARSKSLPRSATLTILPAVVVLNGVECALIGVIRWLGSAGSCGVREADELSGVIRSELERESERADTG